MATDVTKAAQAAAVLQRGDVPFEIRAFLHEAYQFAHTSENGKVFFGFSEEAIKTILLDRFRAGRLCLHRGPDKRINGLFAWYRFNKGWTFGDLTRWKDDDPNGDEIFLAYVFSDNKAVTKALTLKFIEREPDCLHLLLSGIRQKGPSHVPTRVEYPQKFLTRLIKNG